MIRVSGVSGLLGELLLLLGQAGHWMKVGCVKPSGVSGRGAKDFLIAPSLNSSFECLLPLFLLSSFFVHSFFYSTPCSVFPFLASLTPFHHIWLFPLCPLYLLSPPPQSTPLCPHPLVHTFSVPSLLSVHPLSCLPFVHTSLCPLHLSHLFMPPSIYSPLTTLPLSTFPCIHTPLST